MTNRQTITNTLQANQLTLGCYDPLMEAVPTDELKKVLSMLDYGTTDVLVYIDGHPFVVEISHCDNEVDLKLTNKEQYELQYGRVFS